MMAVRNKMVFLLVLSAVLLGTMTSPVSAASVVAPVQSASTASCTQHSAYTDWYNNGQVTKPTLYIWGIPNYGNDTTGIGIYYWDEIGGWIQVSASSEWGIILQPQHRHSDWTGYYIATRWYYVHPWWNDDWRWYVETCR